MALPTPERWQALSAHLDELLDLETGAQQEALQRIRERDASLGAELARLLAAHRDASSAGFLTGSVSASLTASGQSGLRCGPYTLLSLVGRGGMGSVWRAERSDGRYDAQVAVKLLSSALLGDAAQRRFQREGELLARLQHPNIATLLDAGIGTDGQPFLVLELVDGLPIDEYVREQRLDIRARVALFRGVIDAVAHAHTKLVVHRDLKPSNVLVDRDGRVKLLDFGIAKLLDHDDPAVAPITALTHEGSRLLTPAYAAPEQISGGDISTATDVYALGVLLFELLTGERPYRVSRDSMGALEEAIVTGNIYRPSERPSNADTQRALRGDLDTIVLKALRTKPEERYASVVALDEDLDRWLTGRPVRARPNTVTYRAVRFAQRHALAVGAAAVTLVAVLGGAGVAIWQASVARAEQQRAQAVTAFISSVFVEADPYEGDGSSLNATDLLLQAKARLDASLQGEDATRLELLLLLARSLSNLQAFDEAEPIAAEARALAARLYGDRDVNVLRADVITAEVLRFRGGLEAMDSLVRRTIAVLDQSSAPDSGLLSAALTNASHVAIDRGQPDSAVPYARRALAVVKAHLPAGHPEIATVAQVLAISMQNGSTTPAEALVAAEEAMSLTRAQYTNTPSHPRMVEGLLAYGRALGNAGDPRQAIRVHEEALSLATTTGDSRIVRAFIFGNGAKYRGDIGTYAAALADYDSALAVLASVGDTAGVSYAITLGNRGEMLYRLGRGRDALAPLERSQRMLVGFWGDDHPRVAQTRLRLAMAEAAAGRVAQSNLWLTRVANGASTEESGGQLAHARGVTALAGARPAEALREQLTALSLLSDTTAAGPLRDRARIYLERGRAEVALGRTEAARASFEQVIADITRAGMEPTTREAETARRGLAQLQSAGR